MSTLLASRQPESAARAGRPTDDAARWGRWVVGVVALVWTLAMAGGFVRGVLLLTILGFALCVAGVRVPVAGVFGITLLCVLDPVSRVYLLTGGLWRFNTFNYWLLLSMAIFAPAVVGLLRERSMRPYLYLISVLAVWLLWSPDREAGIQHLLGVAILPGLMLAFRRAAGVNGVWYWAAVVAGSIAGMGGAVFFLQQESLRAINKNAWSFFPLAALFAICLAAPFARFHRFGAPLLLSLAVMQCFWIFLSASRGSMAIGLVCLAYLFVATGQWRRRLLFVALGVVLVVVAGGQFLAREEFATHGIRKLLDPEQTMAGRTSGRSDLAMGALYLFQEHPFGIGTGGFAPTWAELGDRPRLQGFGQGVGYQAHSAWTKTLAENGVVGIIALAAFVASFAWQGRRTGRRGLARLGVLATMALAVAFLSTEFQGKCFWFLAAGASTLIALHGRPQQQPSPGATPESQRHVAG